MDSARSMAEIALARLQDHIDLFLCPKCTGDLRIAGGGMEHVEAVGNLRAATAVFAWIFVDWRYSIRAS